MIAYTIFIGIFGLIIFFFILIYIPLSEVNFNVVKVIPDDVDDYTISLATHNPIYKYQINVFDKQNNIIREIGISKRSKLHKELNKK